MGISRIVVALALGMLVVACAGSVQAQSKLKVKVTVRPNPVRSGAMATATVKTARGADCFVSVHYADGQEAPGFVRKYGHGHLFVVPASGTLSFTWQVQTKSHLGFVAAGCAATAKRAANGRFIFSVLQR